MNEAAYSQCSWGGSPYASDPQGRPIYATSAGPHHPAQEPMYGPPPGTPGYPPGSGVRGGPAAYHRASPASSGYYQGGGYMETQQQVPPPQQVGPMTSPNPRACYTNPSSMDTSGYTSPGGRMSMGDEYMGPPVMEGGKPAGQPQNPSTPTSAASGDHRWFSSAQMCLP